MFDFYRSFIPGPQGRIQTPLARFTPPLPGGMVSAWLKQEIPTGSWILDPFGSSPSLVIEAASAGFQVLAASNNPILRFILEFITASPQKVDFQAAVAALAKERHDNERLETHLASLYLTECPTCSSVVPAVAYLWRREEERPFARYLRCTHCDFEGESPVTPFDLEHLHHIGSDALHRARALQRLGLENEQARTIGNEALQTYLSRPLYVIFTLLNRIESAPLPEKYRQHLRASLLQVFDEGNTLWPYPAARTRPRSLSTPPVFRENNLWLAFEAAMQSWLSVPQPIPLTHWPELPPASGGICLFSGRLRELLPLTETIPFEAALAAIPRPSQAFWTLSALWSGWFWGPEAVAPLKSAFQRRRYDWNWHTSALYSTMAVLSQRLVHKKYFTIVPEMEPGFLTAIFVAFEKAGFILDSMAFRSEPNIAQMAWRVASSKAARSNQPFEVICRDAILEYLEQKNEPASYLQLLSQCLGAASKRGAVPIQVKPPETQPIRRIQAAVEMTLTSAGQLRHQGKTTENIETGYWWLEPKDRNPPQSLSDQVENQIIRYLQAKPGIQYAELDENLCREFPGLFTPPASFIQACLESYAESSGSDPVRWSLYAQETPTARTVDVDQTKDQLRELGSRLGFLSRGNDPLVWVREPDDPLFLFHIISTSILSPFIFQNQLLPPAQCIVVLPGSRSTLLLYKMQRNGRLAEAAARGWHFLKYRHLQRLAKRAEMSRDLWLELLDTDPPMPDKSRQIVFF